MEREEVFWRLRKSPVVAALRREADVREAATSKVGICIFLTGDLLNLPSLVERVKEKGKLVFIDIDLVKGIAKDEFGIRYLAKEVKVEGIVSTHSGSIHYGKREGLITIQRIFMLDSAALETGIKTVRNSDPHLVEVLPGLIFPFLVSELTQELSQPLIAGGFIRKEREIKEILSAGALAITTSVKKLWNYIPER